MTIFVDLTYDDAKTLWTVNHIEDARNQLREMGFVICDLEKPNLLALKNSDMARFVRIEGKITKILDELSEWTDLPVNDRIVLR